ncbi:MAG: DNA repair protein RecN [Pseudomonadales bacterium]|nr:DNA repair protein RecN [Pseudomonadales bacterium]
MLLSLSISQYTIAEKLNIDFGGGMTAITGETGAGKSIALDALGLALGARADSGVVRYGSEKADIRAVFDISSLKNVKQWLKDNDFDLDGCSEEDCILRRVVTKEGRSRAYINGQPVNLQTLKQLGSMLVDIHSQHAHHQLLQREYHQTLLDAFGKNHKAIDAVANTYSQWLKVKKQIRTIETQNSEAEQRREYLQFQLKEFVELQIQDDEYSQLEQQHTQQANAETLKDSCMMTLAICRDNEQTAVLDQLQHCIQQLHEVSAYNKPSLEAVELLSNAQMQIEEACYGLRNELESLSGDHQDIKTLEQRLASFHDLARKHRVDAKALQDVETTISEELQSLDNSEVTLEELATQNTALEQAYMIAADHLSQQRQKSAGKLTLGIKRQLKALGMGNCEFTVALNSDANQVSTIGFDNIEFLVSTNPGQPPQGLQKIASGGELSRISLAIQVITAKSSTIPTLVFDEVDVGIGGATAEVVGRLLKELAQSAQIICVTHQPQVASQALQHFFVSKQQQKNSTHTSVTTLKETDKVHEIARMLGGVEITQRTLDHAKEMLAC